MSGIVKFSDVLKGAKGALVCVNLLGNALPPEQAHELISIMESTENLSTLCGIKGTETELDLSSKNLNEGCAVLLSNELKHNEALAELTFSGEKYCAEVTAGNSTMPESPNRTLNECGVWDDPGAFLSFREGERENEIHQDIKLTVTMTEADFSGKHLSVTGAQVLAAFMSTKLFQAKGVLAFLDISDNNLTTGTFGQDLAGATALADALKVLRAHVLTAYLILY
jgi:hypothetical protein